MSEEITISLPDDDEPFTIEGEQFTHTTADPDTRPFVLKNTIMVYEAALLYCDRPPHNAIVDGLDMQGLECWIGRRDPPPITRLSDLHKKKHYDHAPAGPGNTAPTPEAEAVAAEQSRRLRLSWEVATEIFARIKSEAIEPLHRQGDPIPLLYTIRTADFLAVARERGDGGEFIKEVLGCFPTAEEEQDASVAPPEDAGKDGCRPPTLRGQAKAEAQDAWVQKTYGPDYETMPGRDIMLTRARKEPGLSGSTEKDMRDLRALYAPEKLKKGGAPTHRGVPGK